MARSGIEVVINCGAGSVESEAVERERTRAEEAFALAGAEVRVAVVVGAAVTSAVRAAVERGAQIVAVAGGDGTMGSAAGVLAGTDVALGVIALGTFNHFARDLGLPLDLEGAARVIVEGEDRAVDLGDLDGRSFVNTSALGLYPAMVDERDRIRDQRGWGKVRAVPVAAAHVLRELPSHRLRIEVGDDVVTGRTPFVFIGNNRHELGPGGPRGRTRLDEGVLGCIVAHTTTRRAVLRAVGRAVLGRVETDPDIEILSGPTVTVTARSGRSLPVALDGELMRRPSPLRYSVRPGALTVRVPRP